VVIVEGYMDVIAAHQFGFNNVVACMGTALTPEQLRQLQRYTNNFVLALDADAAGQAGDNPRPEPGAPERWRACASRWLTAVGAASSKQRLNANLAITTHARWQRPGRRDPYDRRNAVAGGDRRSQTAGRFLLRRGRQPTKT
jgi:DNA primase